MTYRHENGVVYSGSLTVGAQSRATVLLPSWLPDGSLGVTLSAAQGFAAERAVYGGTGWTLGHAGVPSPGGATTWRFAEGVTGSFDTFFLLVNVTGTATTATLTSTTSLGATVTTSVYVPANRRATLWANAVQGLSNATFRSTVTASVPIVVERAMYWPGTAGAAASPPPTDLGPTAPGPASPQPYTALVEATPVGSISAARAAGSVSPEETARLAAVAATRARLGPAAGVVTFTTPVLPWVGGHVVLGRVP